MSATMTAAAIRSTTPTDEWSTPWWLIHAVEERYGSITLDACATGANARCATNWHTPLADGLAQRWRAQHVWCNPPYSDITPWAEAAKNAVIRGDAAAVTMILPARTELVWWQRHVVGYAAEVVCLRPRVAFVPPPGFEGPSRGPSWPSCLVRFVRGMSGPPRLTAWDVSAERNAGGAS